MSRCNREYSDALLTMQDMQKQGRMSHAERVVIERAITERHVPEFDSDVAEHLDRTAGGPTRGPDGLPIVR